MTTGELIGNARNFAVRTLGKTKTLALVFLGIRKARVNRQDAGRIAVARSVREQQALARGHHRSRSTQRAVSSSPSSLP